MTRRVFALLLIAVLLGMGAFVWPTQWRYDKITVNSDTYLVRIHRVSGHADILVPEQGWVPAEDGWGDETSGGPNDSRT
jgi:hypothetical protein